MQETNIQGQSNQELIAAGTKVISTLALVVCTFIVLYIWLNMDKVCSDENCAWGGIAIEFMGVLCAFIVGFIISAKAKTLKRLIVWWFVAIAILGICTIGVTGSKIAYRNFIEKRYEREVAKISSYSTLEQCGQIVNNKIIVYPPEHIIRNFSSYYNWRTCLYHMFQSETDYPTCLQQAGDKVDYYGPPLKEDCANAKLAVTAISVIGCDAVQPKGNIDTFMHPNAYDLCYTHLTGSVAPSGTTQDQNVTMGASPTNAAPSANSNTTSNTNIALSTNPFMACHQLNPEGKFETCIQKQQIWHPSGEVLSIAALETLLSECQGAVSSFQTINKQDQAECIVQYAAWSQSRGRPEVCAQLQSYVTGDKLKVDERNCYTILCIAPNDQKQSCISYHQQNP